MEEPDISEAQDVAIRDGDEDGDRSRADMPLRERMAVIEREWREMQVEWLSMYDQFRSLYGRISRRQQREEQVTGAQAEAPINPRALALLKGSGS